MQGRNYKNFLRAGGGGGGGRGEGKNMGPQIETEWWGMKTKKKKKNKKEKRSTWQTTQTTKAKGGDPHEDQKTWKGGFLRAQDVISRP